MQTQLVAVGIKRQEEEINLGNGKLLANGEWSDFITDFMAYTQEASTPDLFRRWTAIALVAGALERRVYARVGDRKTYPNLYCLLVAPPGTGKYIIEEAQELWREVRSADGGPALHVASNSVTRASLVDELMSAKSVHVLPAGLETYHSLLIAAEEFEVLLSSYDSMFISLINRIWNNPDHHDESRRHGPARSVRILNPQLNILGGATPAYFTAHFPEEAWSTGLIRRIIMVYADAAPLKDIFAETPQKGLHHLRILSHLGTISNLWGQMKWHIKAAEHLGNWHLEGETPVPTHSKLVNYNTSRAQLVTKLAIISAISRTCELAIDLIDVERAMQWLFEAERLMPSIFRAMLGKSDKEVLEELHYFVQAYWVQQKQKPVRTASIIKFLSERTPSERVPRILEIAERSGMIAHPGDALDLWIPRPRHLHGIE